MSAQQIDRIIARLAHQILEPDDAQGGIVLIGIRRGGEQLARRISSKVEEISGVRPGLGFLNINLYRDDDVARSLPESEIHEDLSGKLVITRVMAEDFYQQDYDRRFHGGQVLEQFRAQVLPGLRWSEPQPAYLGNSWKSKAREIIDRGFDEEMLEALHHECLPPSEDQVNFVTGEPYHRDDRYRQQREETQEYIATLAGLSLNSTQSKILDYLQGINAGHLFLRKLEDNRVAIEAAIQQLSPEVQAIRYRILKTVQLNPNVYYLPSASGHTSRLSPKGDTLLGLKREVRKAATAGWVECDLRSSQFAILAAKLQAPISQAFIASGESLWRELYRHVSGTDADPPSDIKSVLKEAIYSLCYGKSKANLKKSLSSHGMVTVLQHPILVELLALRERWFEQIRRDGGAHDVWGAWQPLDDSTDRWEGSVAASVIQSVELEIIAPIFDVAAASGKSDHFSITLFQHDGATLSFNAKGRVERAKRKLKRAVEGRARQLGVSTVLEFTQL